MTTEVHAIQKHHHSKNKCLKSNLISGGKSSSWDKVERNLAIVVIPTIQSNALLMARNVSNARRRILSQKFVRVQIRSQVVGVAMVNVFQGTTFMKLRKQSSNMTLILWNLNGSSFQHPCLTPVEIL